MTSTPHTATVSDEAVQSACEVIRTHDSEQWGEDGGNEMYCELVTNMLTAALPHLALSAAPCSVEVREELTKKICHIILTMPHDTGFEDVAEAILASILSQIVTKPVDVAAGREQLYREAYEDAVTDALNICRKFDDISLAEIESGIKALQPDPKIIRALSPAEPVDQSRVAQLEAALTSILFEDSDKSEQQRMIDRVKARAILEQSEPVDQWQDIATAEKRAFDVILRVLCKGSGTGYREVIGHYAEDLSGSEQPPFKGWFSDSGNGNGFRQISPDPTHWRRLSPAAPTSKGGA